MFPARTQKPFLFVKFETENIAASGSPATFPFSPCFPKCPEKEMEKENAESLFDASHKRHKKPAQKCLFPTASSRRQTFFPPDSMETLRIF